jgi:hypothetical protein
MLRILGGNPFVGVLMGAVLLAVGLTTQHALLAVAGGFVAVSSIARLVSGLGGGRDEERSRRRNGFRL